MKGLKRLLFFIFLMFPCIVFADGIDNFFINATLMKNGDLVVEAYTQGETWSASGNDQTFVVPEGKLFVMGDNRENSADSRYFKDTFISVDSVKGEAFLHYSLGGDDGIYVKTLRSESPIVVNQ